ncbi:mannose-6-phosphate isomerase class I [Anaerotaenia torta]|uniref:class I mannose-6-phosphate isomerase n=1 Tax=Anaerotaenia torta TaxID=433293 RepID=UPI003D2262D1
MFKGYGNYDKYPEKVLHGFEAVQGYDKIAEVIKKEAGTRERHVVTLELYTEVDIREILEGLKGLPALFINAEDCMVSDEEYNERIQPFLTQDRVFGIMNTMNIKDFYFPERVEEMRESIASAKGLVIVYGVGASLVCEGDTLIYADMARWEIQCRFAKGWSNWKSRNQDAPKLAKFKQGFFVEWRMADRLKRGLFDRMDYLLDTNEAGVPKLVTGEGFRTGLRKFASEPFRLVPYFAPEVWGGQWMKEVCGLDRSSPNYAWAFDGVPEENSLYLRFGEVRIEIPSIDVVFYCPQQLLGHRVHARFGDEYPIRFDFLDTMGGQNLSLQVHPLTEYIQNTFNMHYTQDESYYILDCEENCDVYLGLKDGIDQEEMLEELRRAQLGETAFDAPKYVNTWTVRKHDHYLIPGGTIHCSGRNTMVLEISATPYIFTFKLWDWGRVGLDGLPRPVHIDHGEKVIQWDRTTEWVKENLINVFETISEDEVNKIERTGLHEREFIETRRYTLRAECRVASEGSVSTCNVVDGEGAVIESVDGAFEPFEVHYAETFIIPESVREFILRPLGSEVKILRATVRG